MEEMREKNLSTQQSQKSKKTWLSSSNGDKSRKNNIENQTSKGSSSIERLSTKINNKEIFSKLSRSNKSVRKGPLRITFVSYIDLEKSLKEPFVAFSISKKVGNAVERNLLRRRLRAIAYANKNSLELGAYLIWAEKNIKSFSYSELEQLYKKIINSLMKME